MNVHVPDRSFAAMQHRVIAYTAQIRKAGERHHDCCRSMAEVAEHEHRDAVEALSTIEAMKG